MTRRYSQRKAASGVKQRALLMGAAAMAMVGSVAAIAWTSAGNPTDPQTNCLIGERPPEVEVIAVDTTDKLLAQQKEFAQRYATKVFNEMSPYDRLILVQLSGTDGAPKVLLDSCIPLLNSNKSRREMQERIVEPLKDAMDRLEREPTRDHSPIIEFVVAIADRDDWYDRNGEMRVRLMTDAMQHTDRESRYRQDNPRELPDDLLVGITLELVPLHNSRDENAQPEAFGKLSTALSGMGADVEYAPPRWLYLID